VLKIKIGKSPDIDLHDVVQVAILEQLVRDGARSCEAAEAEKRSCEEEVKASHAVVSCAVLSCMSLSSRSYSDFIGMHPSIPAAGELLRGRRGVKKIKINRH
jgi:hypothetical protein